MAFPRGVVTLLVSLFLAGGIASRTPSAAQTPLPQAPSFRSGTQVVALYATVTDKANRLVPNLTKDDFQVFDNGKPQPLTVFKNEVEPITVAVLLDTSASMTESLDLLRAAAEQFLLRLLPADKGMVGAFNDKIQLSGPFTSSRDDLIAYLQDLDYGNPTRLYDAIDAGLDQLQTIAGRRVILVFTDGDDTASRASFGSVLDRARAEDVMIYAIGLESEYFDGMRRVRTKPDRRLAKLAEETGGGYFELKKTSDLASTFTRVAEELHSQYVLGFSPTVLDGKIHKLEVRIARPGMTVRARKTYVAAADSIAPSGR
ncbi:MAG TPA: VWA domain-containing protein [Vicinamibacterales bacterium]|nr:VWA domain-containing protein [Vicinamibacterales bacterium]